MAVIRVAGGLAPSTVDTPLDARIRVSAVSEIMDIELPYLDMVVYCTGDKNHYRITGLKSKQIGALTVSNAAVDTYERVVVSITDLDLTALDGRYSKTDHHHNGTCTKRRETELSFWRNR